VYSELVWNMIFLGPRNSFWAPESQGQVRAAAEPEGPRLVVAIVATGPVALRLVVAGRGAPESFSTAIDRRPQGLPE
jgi:hypothetical protein